MPIPQNTQINNKEELVIDRLIEKGLIDRKHYIEYDGMARIAGKSVREIMAEKKIVDQEELAQIVAEVYGMPYENIIGRKFEDSFLQTLPLEVAENYKIICFESTIDDRGKLIKVGVVDPDNFKAFEAVAFLARNEKYTADYYVISRASFDYAFRQYKTLKKEVSAALENKIEDEKKEERKSVKDETQEVIKSAPVAKIVSVIIRHAIDGGASDIHIEPLKEECRVRYRIDGILHTSLTLPRNVHNSIISRIKVLANLKLDETRIPQDGRIRLAEKGKEFDFRVSVLPLVGDEKVVMRILDTSRGAPSLDELGFEGVGFNIISNNVKNTSGMLLVTGPTGSGKSTTLFSVLNILNKEGVNISTLEDPVEYFVKGVNQSQIRPEIGFSFASGLRSLLRQDPNVIMVGEIRDSETAELAVHSSLTGHLVLSTLHTNNAIGAIPRLLDMGIEPFLLISTINTVVAQRLARKICQNCKEVDPIPAENQAEILAEIAKIPPKALEGIIKPEDISNMVFYHGKGCPRCGNTGYSGRVCVAEVINVNDKLKEMISGKKMITYEDVIKTQPFITMKQDGYLKVIKGMTTVKEVLRILQD